MHETRPALPRIAAVMIFSIGMDCAVSREEPAARQPGLAQALRGEWSRDGERWLGRRAEAAALLDLRQLLPAECRIELEVEDETPEDARGQCAVVFESADGNVRHALVWDGGRSALVFRREKSAAGAGIDQRDGVQVPAARSLALRIELAGSRLRVFADDELAIDTTLAWDLRLDRWRLRVDRGEAAFSDPVVSALSAEEVQRLAILEGPLRPIPIIAHRGASADAPENTLAAIRLAIELGADGVEFDVYRSSDGELVLFHDDELDRTTDFRKVFPDATDAKVSSRTFAELRRLDAGSWKGAEFRGERIPTLEDALRLLDGKATPIIEIKQEDIGADVARVVESLGMNDRVFAQSFADRATTELRATSRDIATGRLSGDRLVADPIQRARQHIAAARAVGANAVVVNYRLAHAEFNREVHRHAMSVWVYTVNDAELGSALIRHGIDGIITDVPARFVELLHPGLLRRGPLQGISAATGDDGSPARVDVTAGKVPVQEMLRFLADTSGRPVILGESAQAISSKDIDIESPIQNVDGEMIRALLEANGLSVRERQLDGGRRVWIVEAQGGAQRPIEKRPIIVPGAEARGDGKRPAKQRGFIVDDVPAELRAHLGLAREEGALIRSIDSRLAATRGDIRSLERFDVVLAVGEVRVTSPAVFIRELNRYDRGDEFSLRVAREGRVSILQVKR